MRIHLILRRLTRGGGTERYTVELARQLAARGHAVRVWCQRADVQPDGVEVSLVPIVGIGGLWRAWAWHQAVRGLDTSGSDLVLGLDRSDAHRVFRAGGGAHRAWLEAQEGWHRLRWRVSPRQWLELWLDERAIGAAELVICNSDLARRDVVRLHQHPRVEVVRNGVDLDRFQPDAVARRAARRWWRAEGRVVLFFGSGWRRKGLTTAMQAFARLATPDDRLVVMGHERAPGRWHRLAFRLGIGAQVVWHGPVARPERWLPGADALVLPTRYDPAANVILEALACGVPPVTSARDGNGELLAPAQVVQDPRDAPGFAAALERVLDAGQPARRAARAIATGWPVSRNTETVLHLISEMTR